MDPNPGEESCGFCGTTPRIYTCEATGCEKRICIDCTNDDIKLCHDHSDICNTCRKQFPRSTLSCCHGNHCPLYGTRIDVFCGNCIHKCRKCKREWCKKHMHDNNICIDCAARQEIGVPPHKICAVCSEEIPSTNSYAKTLAGDLVFCRECFASMAWIMPNTAPGYESQHKLPSTPY